MPKATYSPEERAAVVDYLSRLNQAANDFNAASPDLNEVMKLPDAGSVLPILDGQIAATIAYRLRVENIPLPPEMGELSDLRSASLKSIDLYASVEGTIRAAAVDGSLFTSNSTVVNNVGRILQNPSYGLPRRLEEKLIAKYAINLEELDTTAPPAST